MNSKTQKVFVSFTSGVSRDSQKSMRAKMRKLRWRNRMDLSLREMAESYNPVLQGWINYYGSYRRSELYPVWRHFNKTLVTWARKKYKGFGRSKTKAAKFLNEIARKEPRLFAHWRAGMTGEFI